MLNKTGFAVFLVATLAVLTCQGKGIQPDLNQEWDQEYRVLSNEIKRIGPSFKAWKRLKNEVQNEQALILPGDKTPVDVVLRRTEALLKHLKESTDKGTFAQEEKLIKVLKHRAKTVTPAEQKNLFRLICKLRRRITFKNPLLDFDKIVFLKHNKMRRGEVHMVDQYLGFNAYLGGGVFVLSDPFGKNPKVIDVLGTNKVLNGRLKGKDLSKGSFISLDLDYDAKEIVFAWTEGAHKVPEDADWSNQGWTKEECLSKSKNYHQYHWRPESSYHIFKAKIDGS